MDTRGRRWLELAATLAAPLILPAVVAAADPLLDVDASVTMNMPGPNGSLTTIFTSTHGLPGSVDTGPVGTGNGAACPDTIGPGYVCGEGFASVSFTHYLAGTLPQPLPIAVLNLGAQSTLKVHDATAATTYTIDSEARAALPFGCYGPSPALSVELIFNVHFDGTRIVSPAVPGFTSFFANYTNSPATCTTSGGLCHESSSPLKCDGSRKTETIVLEPYLFLKNDGFLSGWDADIDLDAAHTMTIESVDVVDDQQQPIPGARAWIADADGQPAAYFLRSDEVGVVQPIGPTPPTTPGPGATPTASPTPTPTATPAVCGTFAKPKLTLGKMLPPPSDDTLGFSGVLPLPTTARDPDLGGVVIRLADAGGTIVDATLPAGAYDKATKTGWKVNPKRTKWTWTHPKANAPSGVVKAVVATKKDGVAVAVKAVGGDFAAGPPVTFTWLFPQNGECASTAFDAPPEACTVKSKGKTLVCK